MVTAEYPWREEGVLGPALKDNKEQTLGCRARGTKGLGSGPQQGAEFTKGSCASLPLPCFTVWKEIITGKHCVETVKLPEVIGKARYHLDKARCLDLCCPSPLKQSNKKLNAISFSSGLFLNSSPTIKHWVVSLYPSPRRDSGPTEKWSHKALNAT